MEDSFFSKKINQTLGAVALIALIIALMTYAFYTMKQSKYLYTGPITISVSGYGEVMAVPDIGQFNFTVTASGTDATQAQSASARSVNVILEMLKNNGVEEKDIKTAAFDVYQNYRDEVKPCVPNTLCYPERESVIDGYIASQNVTVKVKKLDTANNLISEVGKLGATNISSLQFSVADDSTLKAQARTKAIADAKEKARALTNDLDVQIIKMTNYYEENGTGGAMMNFRAEAKDQSASVVPELPTGEEKITSQVNITYIVK